ncbi:MAG: molecular chaperone TorD family protein [bacterium]|nr:molecular chaperone TorD family protein [bacterium]
MNPTVSREVMLPLARSRIYAHLAACFRYPDETTWAEIAGDEARGTFADACAQLAEGKEYRCLRRYADGLPLRDTNSLKKFELFYQEVFGHTISKLCPPYETEYGNMHLFQQSDFLSDLGGLYRAFGVTPQEGKERSDHISIQLEFLYLLSFKEAHALREEKKDEAKICRDAQVAFLEDHLARWAPIFAARLERKNPEGIFSAAARLLGDFIKAEQKALAADPELVPDVSRGEFLPMASDEWDSTEWQVPGGAASDLH